MSSFITLLIKGSKINESAAHNVILQQKSTKEEIDFHIFRQEEAILYRPKFLLSMDLRKLSSYFQNFNFLPIQNYINYNFIFLLTD